MQNQSLSVTTVLVSFQNSQKSIAQRSCTKSRRNTEQSQDVRKEAHDLNAHGKAKQSKKSIESIFFGLRNVDEL